jgi:glycosyltransferase involved in cell wall biosynthesis
LSRIIKAENPHVIYSGLVKPNIVTLMARLWVKSEAAVVITEHNVLSYVLRFYFCRIKGLISFLVKRYYPFANKIIAVSQEVMNDLRGFIEIPDEKGVVMPNMVDVNYIQDKLRLGDEEKKDINFAGQDREFKVVSVGSLHRQKGYDDMIRAISIVNKTLPCSLEILGEGEELNHLKALVEDFGLQGKIKFHGFQENPFKFIKNSDVFAMASLFEGMSCVLLEAMAVGVPIVYTDVSGVRDVAQDGKEILIVPPGNSEAMAEKIIFLARNPESREELARNAQVKVQSFSVERGIRKIEELFLGLCP